MPSELNLYQRINEIRKKIDYIKKDKNVSTGQSGSYKAVTHDQVCALTRDHMVTFGIICFPYLIASKMNDPKVDKDGNLAKQTRFDTTYDFKFVNADNPTEFEVIRIEAHAMDNADKAPGKALSYAKKYAILKLFEIETGESDESSFASIEFDLQFHLELINGAENVESARKFYLEAKKQATAARDSNAVKEIERLAPIINSKFTKEQK